MILNSKDFKFKLEIIGYEFQSSTLFEDLNWLLVEVFAEDSIQKWKTQGAVLTTGELQKLCDWFKKLDQGDFSQKRIEFLESEISFEIDNEKNYLIVILTFEFHPKGKNFDYSLDSGYQLLFELNSRLIGESIDSLEKLIKVFPVRYQSNFS